MFLIGLKKCYIFYLRVYFTMVLKITFNIKTVFEGLTWTDDVNY